MVQFNGLLKWWLVQSTIALAFLYCYYLGLFHMLWDADVSKISFFILTLYVGVSGLIGLITSRAELAYTQHKKFIDVYIPICWHAASEMTVLGLIGTVIGFILLLGPTFAGLNLADAAATQTILAKMAIGMSTALTTTLVGLVCAILTRLQLVNLDTIVDEHEQSEQTIKE
ncbi:hypothetical protein E4H12_16010 [Candidatus Thorarchaeota archaeon]|nr:MAG: hypothetical protein E4H12_16010 [Candidatus Thorarchaeota archaeon]